MFIYLKKSENCFYKKFGVLIWIGFNYDMYYFIYVLNVNFFWMWNVKWYFYKFLYWIIFKCNKYICMCVNYIGI